MRNVLKKIPFFRGLTVKELDTILSGMSEKRFRKNQIVFEEGSIGDTFYIVKSGSIRITKQISDGKVKEEETLGIRKAGEFFGEMALIDDEPRSAKAVAHVGAVLILMERKYFDYVIKNNANVAYNTVQTLSQRLRDTDEHLIKRLKGLIRELEDKNAKLNQFNKTLEEKVRARTTELQKSNEDLIKAYKDLQQVQLQLVHSEKMASLGGLVAGVAHELNNPINFINGNMYHLRSYLEDLKSLVIEYDGLKLPENEREALDSVKRKIQYDFLLDDLENVVESCEHGSARAKQIVEDLKSFSRLDEAEVKEIDIHDGLESTLNLLVFEYRDKVTVHKDYGKLPRLECFASQLNQVFMNVLSNAVQAIEKKGEIWITTQLNQNKEIEIIVRDNGRGIPQDNLSKIFDPFFTTKEVGSGTGLGLSISYGIMERHGGRILVDSNEGEGSTFTLVLPRELPVQDRSSHN